ncbi:ATP-grasp domain-containing protein [Demequina sp. SO4-13]|uniref:ATP-grasp domain-containing protein n=1 Tax=Demequina sp. SO4-13 TaxID=3401027 RepID=UPI003AF83FC7
MSKNIFVVGLDEENLSVLRRVPGAEDYRFHQLLTVEDLQEDTVSVPALIARAERQLDEFDGEIDAIVGYWDFPSTLMVPILCERHGLRSAPMEAVVKCEHKYWSRLIQRSAIDEHPAFGLLDLEDDDPVLPSGMSYPVWIKPIESYSSEGAHYIDGEERLREALESERETVDRLSGPFRALLDRFDFPEEIVSVTDRMCLVEEAATGYQMTVEGFCKDGEAVTYGVVDSITYEQAPSFLRYQYPATRIDQATQDHMCDVARRVMVAVGLDNSTFNIEFFWDPDTETLALLEINARHSQSHALMFEHVDGVANHAYMLDLALGRRPTPRTGNGRYGVAAKWFVRSFTDGVVARTPTDAEIAACEREIDGVRVHVTVDEGERLSAGFGEDSYSYVLAEIFIGAADERDLTNKYSRCLDALPFEIDEVSDPETLDTMGPEHDTDEQGHA